MALPAYELPGSLSAILKASSILVPAERGSADVAPAATSAERFSAARGAELSMLEPAHSSYIETEVSCLQARIEERE
jgi:hypothetical protein